MTCSRFLFCRVFEPEKKCPLFLKTLQDGRGRRARPFRFLPQDARYIFPFDPDPEDRTAAARQKPPNPG
jgi:hypothetical protein